MLRYTAIVVFAAATLYASFRLILLLIDLLFSSIQIVDPVDSKYSVVSPHDLVVIHRGCGKRAGADSFTATLDGKDITDKFMYWDPSAHLKGSQEKWIAKDVDLLPSGRHILTVSAIVPDDSGCVFYQNEDDMEFRVSDFLEPGIHKGLLHDPKDRDEHLFKAESPNGSWFQISVQAENPADSKLHAELRSSTNGLLEQADKTASKFWIALARGVIGKITVTRDRWPYKLDTQTYKLEVISKNIDDRFEPNDSADYSKRLKKNTANFAYMAGVLDANGKKSGLKDWFYIDHDDCTIDCMEVLTKPYLSQKVENSPYYLEYLKKTDNGNLSGCHNGFKKSHSHTLCTDEGCDNEEGDGKRFLVVSCMDANDTCDVYGEDDIPERYRSPYQIKWYSNCTYNLDEQGNCDRENPC